MDEQNTNQANTGAEAQPAAPQQSAQDDLKKVADRAKAAATGFDFMRLFVGRVGATNFLYSVIIGVVAGAVLSMIPVIGWIISIGLAVLGVGMSVRRLHDINVTGWASIALFIPVLGLLGVIYLCWKHGDVGSNQYGGVPDPKRDVFKAILNT